MKDYEIPKVQINIVTHHEVLRKFMKIEGIYLSIPENDGLIRQGYIRFIALVEQRVPW